MRRATALAVSFRRLFLSIASHFYAIHSLCVPRSRKSQKKTKRKPPILGGRGSTSFNVIDIDTVKRFVTMISSMSASICKRFQATQANSNKITILGGYPSLTPACAALLEPKESKLAAIKSTLNAENFMCRWFWSKPISSHFGAVHS